MVCRGQKIIPDGCFEDVVVSEKLKSHPCGGVVVAGSFPLVPFGVPHRQQHPNRMLIGDRV